MWRRVLVSILYRAVLALPEVLLKDKNQKRKNKAKRIMFNPEQIHFDSSNSEENPQQKLPL